MRVRRDHRRNSEVGVAYPKNATKYRHAVCETSCDTRNTDTQSRSATTPDLSQNPSFVRHTTTVKNQELHSTSDRREHTDEFSLCDKVH